MNCTELFMNIHNNIIIIKKGSKMNHDYEQYIHKIKYIH